MIEEFNADEKAEYGQLIHTTRNNKKEETIKRTNTCQIANAHLVRYSFKIREGSPEGTWKIVEERICERDDRA